MPTFLARVSYLLINKRATARSVILTFPSNLDPQIAAKADSSWHYELMRTRRSLERAESFASLWGFITILAVTAAVVFLIPPFHQPGRPFGTTANVVSFAVLGATVTTFLIDFAAICLRTSQDDTSRRTFAESINRLLLALLATLGVVLLAKVTGVSGGLDGGAALDSLTDKDGDGSVRRVLTSVGLGAGVAIVGVPVFEHLRDRIAKALGLTEVQRPRMTPLMLIAGIGPGDANRLAEEGIDSVEALINTPVPRIFLNTRFSLARICDWIDRGLLLYRLGDATVADLRARLGVTGVLDLLPPGADEAARTRVISGLRESTRAPDDEQANMLLGRILGDQRFALAQAFKSTLVTRLGRRSRGLARPAAHKGNRAAEA